MAFKINIGTKEGKTYKLESETEELVGKELGEKIPGKTISADLEGYEFEITGTSDKSGFTSRKDVDGAETKKLLLSYEKGMKTRPRQEGKKKHSNKTPKGLRLRKTIRGKVISKDIRQINLKVLKDGKKSLKDIFEKPAETPVSEPAQEKKE